MKDLYTFDYSAESALKTYEEACAAYRAVFDEMKLPYLVAEADTGDIGGKLSHEFHLPAPMGDDNVITCTDCNYVANEELATTRIAPVENQASTTAQVWRGISRDRKTLVNVWYPTGFTDTDINPYALKASLPDLDSGLEDALPLWETALNSASGSVPQLLNIVDYRLGPQFVERLQSGPSRLPALPSQGAIEPSKINEQYMTSSKKGEPINALRIHDGDRCPRCDSGVLEVQKAIELGHTFNLGTKYSEALEAHVQVPSNMLKNGDDASAESGGTVSVPMQMGCHGIGVSRIIGAVADHLSDAQGLNWPRAIAPFEVVVISNKTKLEEDAVAVANALTEPLDGDTSSQIDLVLDDRDETLIHKLNDATLIGYPVIVVLGRKWKSDRLCEVQCRRLHSSSLVSLVDLPGHVYKLLAQL